jgi:hypothetical protein
MIRGLAIALILCGGVAAQTRMTAKAPPDMELMLAYRLTSGMFDKYVAASRTVSGMIAKDATYRQRTALDPKDAPHSVDATVQFAKSKLPEYYAAVEKSGISFREYTLFEGSLAYAWVGAMKPHPGSKVHVLPENLQFVQEHKEQVAAILNEQRKR